MADWPPSLKPVGKYIVRAREVQATQPLVAYYCNYYALKRAIELRNQSDERANRLVTGLLEKCEAAKATVGVDDGSHRGIVEEFALSVFDRADTEDREDRATKETAQTFYAAVCFFEVCSVFAPLTSDLDQRLRYAKWKAVDISKALKEGRRPIPGAPGEAEALAEEERWAAEAEAAAPKPAASAPSADVVEDADVRQDPGAAYPQPKQVPPAPPVKEYDSDLQDYQPQHMSKDRSADSGPYPSVAPPYPSADISPLPQQGQYASQSNSAYPSVSSAYPTSDGPYGNSNSAYPTTSGYPAPSAPYIPPSAPYATEDASQPEQSKGPVMPPIPTLDIPGIGTNMGDPAPAQQYQPPNSEPYHTAARSEPLDVPPQPEPVRRHSRSEPMHLPPRSEPVRTQSRSAAINLPPQADIYAPPHAARSEPLDLPAQPEPVRRHSRSGPMHPPPRSEPVHTQSRSAAIHLPPQADIYAPPQSDPYAAPQADPYPPPQSDATRLPQRSELAYSQPEAPQLPGRVPPPAAVKRPPAAVPNYKPSIKDTQEAQRLAKYAASALDFQDLKTAVANLEDALNLLKGTR